MLIFFQAMDLFDMSKEHGSLVEGLSQVTCPVMVVGVKSDILFPIMQQQELADTLLESGIDLNYCILKKNRNYVFKSTTPSNNINYGPSHTMKHKEFFKSL